MATPGFLEEYAKDYATQAKGAYSVPIDTSQFTGRDFVAGEDPLQTQAIGIAQQGVGSYQPFLTAAGTQGTAAGTTLGAIPDYISAAGTQLTGAAGVTGAGAGTGTGTVADYMSPYQTQVIDTT